MQHSTSMLVRSLLLHLGFCHSPPLPAPSFGFCFFCRVDLFHLFRAHYAHLLSNCSSTQQYFCTGSSPTLCQIISPAFVGITACVSSVVFYFLVAYCYLWDVSCLPVYHCAPSVSATLDHLMPAYLPNCLPAVCLLACLLTPGVTPACLSH